MRIAFVAHLSELSGAGVALVDVARAFADGGHDVQLVLPGEGPLLGRARACGMEPTLVQNTEQDFRGGSLLFRVGMIATRLHYVRELTRLFKRQNVDVVYVNSTVSVFAGVAGWLARKTIVWHVHETLDQPSRSMRVKMRIIRKLSSGLVYASRSAQAAFPPDGLPSMVARNAIDFPGLARARDQRLEEGSVAATAAAPVYLFLNGTIRRKGADVLLQAVQQLLHRSDSPAPQLAVTITGAPETDPTFFAQLQAMTESGPLRGIVDFAGIQTSLLPQLRRASLFISASRNEALPISIVEAMAAGVPVIATDVGDCADLLDNGAAGWVVPPDDAAALAAAIGDALGNPAERRSRAECAFQKVQRLYGGADFWAPLLGFVEGVAAQGCPARGLPRQS